MVLSLIRRQILGIKLNKKKNYQKKVGKPAQKANIVSTKKKSEPRKVTKADIDFNTNIMKKIQEVTSEMELFSEYVKKQCELHRMVKANKYY